MQVSRAKATNSIEREGGEGLRYLELLCIYLHGLPHEEVDRSPKEGSLFTLLTARDVSAFEVDD